MADISKKIARKALFNSYHGPEFISVTLASWAEEHGIALKFIKPRKPIQNSFIERFNRTYRTEILNMYVFRTLNEDHPWCTE